jgi:hypothetical protein
MLYISEDWPQPFTVALHKGLVRTSTGGPDAPLGADVSAAGLKKVLLGLSVEESGGLIDSLGYKRDW